MIKKNIYRRLLVLLTALSSTCLLYPAYAPSHEDDPFDQLPDLFPDFNGDSGCQQGVEDLTCVAREIPCPDGEAFGARGDCMDQVLLAGALDNPRNGQAGGRISENHQDGRLEDDIDEEGDGGGEGDRGQEVRAEADLPRDERAHSDEKPWKCEAANCTKKFSHKGGLTAHMRMHSGDMSYTCQQCQRSFISSSVLKVHIRTHTEETPYICERCSKGFTTSAGLTLHMRIHADEKPFACPKCGQRFTQRVHLNRHLKAHGKPKIANPQYTCSACNIVCDKRNDFMKHMRAHIYSAQKMLTCKVCGKPYKSKGPFQKHQASCLKKAALVQAHEC